MQAQMLITYGWYRAVMAAMDTKGFRNDPSTGSLVCCIMLKLATC